MNNRYIFIVLLIITSTVGFSGGLIFTKTLVHIDKNSLTAEVFSPTTTAPAVEQPPKDTSLFFVGDIMLDRAVRTSVVKNFKGDYNKLFDNLDELKNADILFGNLEGAVSNIGNNVGSKYSFRMDPLVLPALKEAGFDIVSFANNHVGDWNMVAFKDTITGLSDVGILQAGAGMTKKEAEEPKIIIKNGTRFGFIGFSDVGPSWMVAKENNPGILLASDPRFSEIIKNAKENSDILIVSFHFGTEYKKIHNKHQEMLARSAVDNGADMVIGHHPHVIQDIEIYNGKPIVYSLGNFIFDQYFSKDTMRGMLFEAVFSGTKLKETKYRIIELNKFYQPTGIYEVESTVSQKLMDDSCPKPKREYEDESYLNVGQEISLEDESYIPSDLVLLDKSMSVSNICLKKNVADAVAIMINRAKLDGYKIKVSSGFRNYDTQEIILNRNLKNNNQTTSVAVAKPGHSEHQLGTTIDLTGSSISYDTTSGKFEGSTEAKWLEVNASKYGFIESYPKEKVDITGYMYEPWHYRYIGIDMAKEVIESGKTLNQYLKDKKEAEILKNKTTQ